MTSILSKKLATFFLVSSFSVRFSSRESSIVQEIGVVLVLDVLDIELRVHLLSLFRFPVVMYIRNALCFPFPGVAI